MNTDINTLIEERKKFHKQEALTWIADKFIEHNKDYACLLYDKNCYNFFIDKRRVEDTGLPYRAVYDYSKCCEIIVWKSEEARQKWEDEVKAERDKLIKNEKAELKKSQERWAAYNALPFWKKLFTPKPTQETQP